MPCSYIEENVPNLIVRDVLRNIPMFYYDIKMKQSAGIRSQILLNGMRALTSRLNIQCNIG
jgi:hypothetical protein